MTLITTWVMGADRNKIRKMAIEAMEKRNEIEENWSRQYKRFSPEDSERESRATTRMRPMNKDSAGRSELRSRERLESSYKSL
jgi:hypothetical protein